MITFQKYGFLFCFFYAMPLFSMNKPHTWTKVRGSFLRHKGSDRHMGDKETQTYSSGQSLSLEVFALIKNNDAAKKQIQTLQYAIKKENLSEFTEFFKEIDSDWFNKNRGFVEFDINTSIAYKLNISVIDEEFENMKMQRGNEIKIYNDMLAVLDVTEHDLRQKALEGLLVLKTIDVSCNESD